MNGPLVGAVILLGYAGVLIVSIIPFMVLFCQRKSSIESLKFKFPTLSFIVFLVFVFALLAGGGILIGASNEDDGDDDQVKEMIGGIVVAIIGYVIYFVGNMCSRAFCATCHKLDVSQFDTHLQQLRDTGVDLHFEIVASHTEKHTRRDSNGNTHTETRTVVTYRGTRYIPVPFWVDLTGPVVIPPGAPFIRILNNPKIDWCHDSEKIIESIRNRLYILNRHRDKTVTVTTHICIPGLVPNLLLRSPLMDPTACQKVRVNPCIGLLVTLFGFGSHHAFVLARFLPVVKHKIHKKASLVQPVFDDSWLKQYKVKGATMTPHGAVFGNVQMVDNWDASQNVNDNYVASQPMFVNPMPLYVPYATALQYETPSAPEMPYMYMDPNMAQAGYAPQPDAMAAVPAAPPPEASAPVMADPSAQPTAPVMSENSAAAMAAAPVADPGYPGADPNAIPFPGQPAYPGQPVDPSMPMGTV